MASAGGVRSEARLAVGAAVVPVRLPRRPGLARRLARNRAALLGVGIVALTVALAALAPIIAPYDPLRQTLMDANDGPSPKHWLGADQLGRDILSRLLHGARLTVPYSVLGVALSMVVGIPIGLAAGYHGRLDGPLMRIVDIVLAFPSMLLAIAVTAALGVSLLNASIAIGVVTIPSFARQVRASVLALKEREFIQAARAIGSGDLRILGRSILPNSLTPIIVQASINIASGILILASLSFLGLGAQPPTPELGAMLADGRSHLRTAPHMATFPGLFIALIVLGFNLTGEGLRDALDPHGMQRGGIGSTEQ